MIRLMTSLIKLCIKFVNKLYLLFLLINTININTPINIIQLIKASVESITITKLSQLNNRLEQYFKPIKFVIGKHISFSSAVIIILLILH